MLPVMLTWKKKVWVRAPLSSLESTRLSAQEDDRELSRRYRSGLFPFWKKTKARSQTYAGIHELPRPPSRLHPRCSVRLGILSPRRHRAEHGVIVPTGSPGIPAHMPYGAGSTLPCWVQCADELAGSGQYQGLAGSLFAFPPFSHPGALCLTTLSIVMRGLIFLLF